MKNSGLHRAGGNADDRGDFVDGMAFHGGEQKYQKQVFRPLTKGAIEVRLEFAARFGVGWPAQKIVPGHATWLDQSQLLHTIPWSDAGLWRPAFPYIQADAAACGLVQRETAIQDIAD